MEEKEHPSSGQEEALLAEADAHLMKNYRPARMVLTRGEGCHVYDTAGRRYLDFCAGIAVCSLGHGHPALVEAIAEQAGRLMHTSNYFYNDQNIRLAAELCAATGFDRAFCCNSGTEANEAMLKVARRYFYEKGQPRTRVIAFENAFHGRTLGALALTGNPKYMEGFGEPLSGIEHVPYGDLDAVRAAMGPDVAAIWVEAVQGEGGVIPAPEGFLQGLREVCDEHGALLMCDEVQTGVGRTGRFLAIEHSGVRADGVALAKGLGGGFPVGALLVREPLVEALPVGAHGTTFGGNPLASRAVRTVLRVLRDDGLLASVTERGEQLGAGLREVAARHPKVCAGGERGLGLIRAMPLAEGWTARPLLPRLRKHGLLAAAGGTDALRFIPPLVVGSDAIEEAMTKLDAALSAAAG